MKRTAQIIFFIMLATFAYAKDSGSIKALFPSVDELHGGAENWVANILPVENANNCHVHSATYAYFTEHSEQLFGIPRNNVYSVNIRFHVCSNVNDASKLYDKFSSVGAANRKKNIPMGDKGFLYVEPSKDGFTGDFYLTSISKYIVMQVHADDGFVLMDMGSMMSQRLDDYLNAGSNNITDGITLTISKEGYDGYRTLIPFNIENVAKVSLKGIVYDQYNQRVPGALITVLETGQKYITDKNGSFAITAGSGKGKTADLFYPLTIRHNSSNALESGYYAVDIYYANSGKTGQDHWYLSVNNSGTFTGSSLNTASQSRLYFSGEIDGSSISVQRPCSSGMVAKCVQNFQGSLKGDIFSGKWTGTGGGGDWKLYKKSFEYKKIQISPAEAGLKLSGEKKGKAFVLNGKTDNYIEINNLRNENDDFYLLSTALRLKILSKKSVEGRVYLFKDKNRATIETKSPVFSLPYDNETIIDITEFYKNQSNAPRYLAFLPETAFDGEITPETELVFAHAVPKVQSSEALQLIDVDFNGKDEAGNSKTPIPNGKPDIAINITFSAFGSTLRGVEIQTTGTDIRKWNSYTNSLSPGVIILDSADKVINLQDGSILYPVENFTENLILHIDKGSVDKSKINGFELIFDFDGTKIKHTIDITRLENGKTIQ